MFSRFAAVLALTLPSAALAEIKVERITYKHGETTLEGVMAYDDAAKDKRPGVLVCHEWWGCNAYAEKRARMLAEQGYVAFALDMYGKGNTTTDAKQAAEWAGKATGNLQNMRERAALGLAVLADHSRTDSSRLAAIGYCMGGTVALELARSGMKHTENLRAIVAFHASNIAARTAEDNKNIKGSVLICHGQNDDFVKPEQITSFHKQMTEAGVDYQFISYAHAVHAFTNPDADKAGIAMVKYNERADRRSWAAMKDLFAEAFTSRK